MNPSHSTDGARPAPPTEASARRQILHTLVALAGWVLFGWWWWIVLGHLSPAIVRMTVLFIGLSLVLIVVLTGIWTIHNLLIFRRRGPRMRVREVHEDYRRDRLGRSVAFKPSLEAARAERILIVRAEHEGKVYRPVSGYPDRPTVGLPNTVPWNEHDAS